MSEAIVSAALVVDTVAAPLDAARRRALAAALQVSPLARLVVDRDRRVAAQAIAGTLAALVVTLVAPAWSLALAPILFGVPHVASDVRYLLLRPRVARPWRNAALVFAVGFVLLRAIESATGAALARLEVAAVGAWTLAALASGWREREANVPAAPTPRASLARAVLVATVTGLGAVAVAHPLAARLVLAHAHNVAALAVWIVIFRRRARAALPPLAVVAASVVALLLVAPSRALATPAFAGVGVAENAAWLAPGVAAAWALRLTLVFAFLQSVHYATWLGWIPQEDLPSEGTTTFRQSLRSLARDLGPGLAVVCALTAFVLVAALFDVFAARDAYVSLATFHGYLEIAMLAYFVARGGRSAEVRR